MALIDEQKLQGNLYTILELLRKETLCCKVSTVTWASSSTLAVNVFVTVLEDGSIKVYDSPGGALLAPTDYGVLGYPL